MSNCQELLQNNFNYAIEPNKYLEKIKQETDKEIRFNILKKYFTENITKNIYQNMDLLHSTKTDFDQFKNMYIMIAKDLFLNILLAVDTLVAERQYYILDTSKVDICNNIVGITSTEENTDKYYNKLQNELKNELKNELQNESRNELQNESSSELQNEYSICESLLMNSIK